MEAASLCYGPRVPLDVLSSLQLLENEVGLLWRHNIMIEAMPLGWVRYANDRFRIFL